jgi:hypothetical protein
MQQCRFSQRLEELHETLRHFQRGQETLPPLSPILKIERNDAVAVLQSTGETGVQRINSTQALLSSTIRGIGPGESVRDETRGFGGRGLPFNASFSSTPFYRGSDGARHAGADFTQSRPLSKGFP